MRDPLQKHYLWTTQCCFADKSEAKMSHPTKTPSKKQFKLLPDHELALNRRQLENQHTLSAEKSTDTVFKQFLSDAGCDSVDYYYYDEDELPMWLSKFWFSTRTKPKTQKKVRCI